MSLVKEKFNKVHAFIDPKGTEDLGLLCDLFVEKWQEKSVTISLHVSMPDYKASSGKKFVLTYEPLHLDKCELTTAKKGSTKAERNKATLSLVLKKDQENQNHNCVIWRPSLKHRLQDDISTNGPRYAQFINIAQAKTVYVEFSSINKTSSIYELESILAKMSRWTGYRAEYAFKGMERWNEPLVPCNKNNKCNTQHLPSVEISTEGAASLTHLPVVPVPETDHSGSPDEKNEQHLVLVLNSQCFVQAISAPGSPSSFLYVPDSMGSPGSPCPMPTLSQIYRREDRRELFRPQYTEELPFGGRRSFTGQDLKGSPTRNLPASSVTSGPTPLTLIKGRLQSPVPGSPTIPSSTGNSCLSALSAEQLTSFVRSKTPESSAQVQESIKHLVTKTVAAHERNMEEDLERHHSRCKQELKAEWSTNLSNTVKSLVEQHFKDLFHGKDCNFDRGTDVGTAKSKELDEESRRLELEEERLLEDKKCLEERTKRLNKRKRELDEARRRILYKTNPR